MINSAMERMLKKGEAIDVAVFGREQPDGTFLLDGFVDGRTTGLCPQARHAPTERWVWSIGQKDDKVFASFDTRFYLSDDHKCLWLR